MGTFLVYILKSALCLALFYLFYKLLLSKETFHRFNRFALLGVLLLSALVPLVEVSVVEPQVWQQDFTQLEVLLESAPYGAVVEQPAFSWAQCLLVVYALGLLFFVGRHLYSLSRLLLLLRRGTCEPLSNYVDSTKQARLVVHEYELAPFSWMKVIVVRRKDLEENGREILIHELAHIGKHHSWDLLLADLCVFLQWFNPAVWLLKQELQTIHEYEADESVINEGVDERKYQLLLIRKAVGTRLYSMANSFNHSSIKKRITMMLKEKSSPWARMKYAYVLPLAAMAVTAFARPEVVNVSNEISNAKVSHLIGMASADGTESLVTPVENVFKISGKVVDARSGAPIAGATVRVRGAHSVTMTDKEGAFLLEGKAGDLLLVSFKDMQPAQVVVSEQQQDYTIMLHLEQPVAEKEEEVVFSVVEQMPAFPGGMQALMQFLGENIKYPEEARKGKVEGCVVVKFVVDREGYIKSPIVVRSLTPELDAEAIRVISAMPQWTPGKQRGKAVVVSYAIPVMFQLSKPEVSSEGVKLTVANDASSGLVNAVKGAIRGIRNDSLEHLPLVVIDGKEADMELLKAISSSRIGHIEVLRQQTAVEMYGEKAKYGVVEVTLKKEGDAENN